MPKEDVSILHPVISKLDTLLDILSSKVPEEPVPGPSGIPRPPRPCSPLLPSRPKEPLTHHTPREVPVDTSSEYSSDEEIFSEPSPPDDHRKSPPEDLSFTNFVKDMSDTIPFPLQTEVDARQKTLEVLQFVDPPKEMLAVPVHEVFQELQYRIWEHPGSVSAVNKRAEATYLVQPIPGFQKAQLPHQSVVVESAKKKAKRLKSHSSMPPGKETEWAGMSGTIAVTVLGLLLDNISYSPGIDIFLTKFWEFLTFLAHTLIFTIGGIVMAVKTFEDVTINDIFYIIVLYFGLIVIRILVIVLLSPLLSRVGYGFNWRWGAVVVWGGMRGAFTLIMTLVACETELLLIREKRKILLHVAAVVLLTLLINSTTMRKMANMLGLSDISSSKRMAMYSAVQHIQESEINTLSMLKLDRFLAVADWNMVENAVMIEDPYKTTIKNVKYEEFFPKVGVNVCPDCKKEIPNLPSPLEFDDMMEEARLRMLKAQMTSYWMQYSSGMLNQHATRTLMSASESYIDYAGKFMDIKDVRQYWEAKGFFVFLRKYLEHWMYNVKTQKVQPSEIKMLNICYYLVHSEAFEFTIYILIAMNTFPLILDFIPTLNDVYHEELDILNYIFITVFVLEALLKALAMRKAYFIDHWNQFDLFILVAGIIDMIIHHLLYLFKTPAHIMKIIRILRFLRLFRTLHLGKIVLPKLIHILNKQIKRQLSFGYDIAKGFVIGEEYVKNLIDQISDQKIIIQETGNI
ncbi:sodium/hydrogen exchanger 10-like [Rhinatrema bivittatum]|uniref:sodium/hydrogen exchanger 10-like n=1 Tax=Rhinatrema bivittatum TaxID=194408 RepID=UPI00112BF967|nr:sodium/hydrogen exchanger 10-like [Rhinatrema bivittatum]